MFQFVSNMEGKGGDQDQLKDKPVRCSTPIDMKSFNNLAALGGNGKIWATRRRHRLEDK